MPTPKPGSPGPAGRAHMRLEDAARRASEVIDQAGSSARSLVAQLPGTAQAARVRANATTAALQTLPDTTLRGLAASSVGLGAGFYLAGVPRLATAAAVAPAMIIGAAIISRPGALASASANR
jgi:hypothetical protein